MNKKQRCVKKKKIRKIRCKIKNSTSKRIKEKGYDLATDLNEILNLIPSKLSNNDNKEELQTDEE